MPHSTAPEEAVEAVEHNRVGGHIGDGGTPMQKVEPAPKLDLPQCPKTAVMMLEEAQKNGLDCSGAAAKALSILLPPMHNFVLAALVDEGILSRAQVLQKSSRKPRWDNVVAHQLHLARQAFCTTAQRASRFSYWTNRQKQIKQSVGPLATLNVAPATFHSPLRDGGETARYQILAVRIAPDAPLALGVALTVYRGAVCRQVGNRKADTEKGSRKMRLQKPFPDPLASHLTARIRVQMLTSSSSGAVFTATCFSPCHLVDPFDPVCGVFAQVPVASVTETRTSITIALSAAMQNALIGLASAAQPSSAMVGASASEQASSSVLAGGSARAAAQDNAHVAAAEATSGPGPAMPKSAPKAAAKAAVGHSRRVMRLHPRGSQPQTPQPSIFDGNKFGKNALGRANVKAYMQQVVRRAHDAIYRKPLVNADGRVKLGSTQHVKWDELLERVYLFFEERIKGTDFSQRTSLSSFPCPIFVPILFPNISLTALVVGF